jgi:hypothetical protein
MDFELSYGDIGILFFLTLGPLKAILPFARATRGTEPAFSEVWRGKRRRLLQRSLSSWSCLGRLF